MEAPLGPLLPPPQPVSDRAGSTAPDQAARDRARSVEGRARETARRGRRAPRSRDDPRSRTRAERRRVAGKLVLRTSKMGGVNAHALAEILDLPTEERIRVAQAIWESVVRNPEAVPVTEAQRRELDARLAAFEVDQDPGEPWKKIKDSLSDK